MTQLRVGLAMALTLTMACSRSPEARYAQFLEAGNHQLKSGDYSRAILEFRNAVQAKPLEAEAHYRMALAYLGANRLGEAVAALRRATAVNPSHSGAQLKLAELMIQSRDPDLLKNAQERVQRVLAENPGDNDASYALAATEVQLGKPAEAEQSLNRILERSPAHLKSALGLAQMKLSRKDFEGAEDVITKVAAQSPDSPDAAIALGAVYAGTGKTALAEDQFRRALQLSPRNASAMTGLAAMQLKAGKIPEAEQTYKQIARHEDKKQEFAYATFLKQQKRSGEVVRELERLLKADPADRQARSWLVVEYVAADRQREARKILDDTLKDNPRDVDALMQRSLMNFAEASFDVAQRDIEQALRSEPASAKAHYLLALIHGGRAELAQQKVELTRTLELDPGLLSARIDLANLLVKSNNIQAAVGTLDGADGKQKGSVGYLIARTWTEIALGNQAAARRNVDAVLKVARIPDALIQDGMLKFAARDFPATRASLDEVLQSNPEDLRALSLLAQTYIRENQIFAGAKKLSSYVAKRPNSVPLHMFLAVWLMEHDRASDARAVLMAVKVANPGLTASDILLARLDSSEGNLEVARRRLATVVSAEPRNLEARMMLAGIEAANKSYEQAIQDYLLALETDDRNVIALNDVAYQMSRYSARLDEALKYAQKARELAPDSSYTQDTLGWIYYRKGMYQMAVRELQGALAKETRPAVQYHLGLTYQRLGDSAQGARLIASALAAQPDLAAE